MIIRPVRPEDVEGGAACHVAVVREAYTGLIDPERLGAATADLAARVALWRSLIAEGRPILVAVDNDAVVAFAVGGPSTEEGVDADFQLFVLNVRQAYWGTGLAQQLHDRAVGDRAAFLWVLEANPRARAFYARNGYRPDGATKIDELFAAPIIRMIRPARDH
jgi:GNAT superfamily N-acetyltransferase